jgi:hypothetical protein
MAAMMTLGIPAGTTILSVNRMATHAAADIGRVQKTHKLRDR